MGEGILDALKPGERVIKLTLLALGLSLKRGNFVRGPFEVLSRHLGRLRPAGLRFLHTA